jgi:bifunctional non-homologous end joining protein LigD
VLPTGNYGAGDVTVWDWGTWEPGPGEDPIEAVRAGELHVELHGQKIFGQFMLVRTSPWRGGNPKKEQWLLFRKRGDGTVAGWHAEDFLWSVKTGRTNEELTNTNVSP